MSPEIGGIEHRAGGRGNPGRFKIRFEHIASVSRPRLRRLAWCAQRPDVNAIAVARLSWTPKKHQSGEIDCSGRIGKERRWLVAHGTLRCRPCHTDQAAQGLFTTEELGDADRQARRHEQGQGGARPPTGGDQASHACRRSPLQRCSSLTGGAKQFGEVTTPGLLKAKCLRRDDGSR